MNTAPALLPQRRIFVPLALFITLIAFVGFWPTYFGKLLAGTVSAPLIIHIHAAVFVLFDPALFGGTDHFLKETDGLTAYVRTCPTAPGSGITLPGDPERAAKAKRLADGIAIPDGTWELIAKTAAELKVPLPT